MKPEDYAGSEPKFELLEYFLGNTRAWGIFQDRNGRVKRQFTVDLNGAIKGDVLVLTEDFIYSDGEMSQRIWRIRKVGKHRYEARANDVVGIARGTSYGQALNWRYQLELTVDDNTWKVNFDDWMFLQPDGVLINRATMSKFGFTLGEVTLFFTKELETDYEKTAFNGRGVIGLDDYFARTNPSFRHDL